ncbi:MAG: SOSS complex subunit B family protein [Nanoarchaeota archaeon]
MQIRDLKPKQGNIEVVVDVVDVGASREFQKFGKPGKVATAIVKDETGDIKLTLWNEDIEKVQAGDKVHLTSGYVSEWQGEMQLTTGRMGKLEVIGKADVASTEKDTKIRTNIPTEEGNGEEPNVEEEDIEDLSDEGI